MKKEVFKDQGEKMIKNVLIQCKICGHELYHDGKQGFITCKCKNCALDCIRDYHKKHKSYIKIIANPSLYIKLKEEIYYEV